MFTMRFAEVSSATALAMRFAEVGELGKLPLINIEHARVAELGKRAGLKIRTQVFKPTGLVILCLSDYEGSNPFPCTNGFYAHGF